MDESRRRSGARTGKPRDGHQAHGGVEPVTGEAADGDHPVHDPGNAAKAGRRGAGMQRGSGEVACVSGTEKVEGDAEGTSVRSDRWPVVSGRKRLLLTTGH